MTKDKQPRQPLQRPQHLDAQREAIRKTSGALAQLLIIYPGLLDDVHLRGNIVKACRTGHRVSFRSGGWRYTFWYLKKGRRLAVSRRREPRRLNVEAFARAVASTYTCAHRDCSVTFIRSGRSRYCSTKCRDAKRNLVRRGKNWGPRNLSPEAQANVKGKTARLTEMWAKRARAGDRAARKEQKRNRSEEGWPSDRVGGSSR